MPEYLLNVGDEIRFASTLGEVIKANSVQVTIKWQNSLTYSYLQGSTDVEILANHKVKDKVRTKSIW